MLVFQEPYTSLAAFTNTSFPMNEKQQCSVWLQGIEALKYLHEHENLIHFQINPETLLIGNNGNLKVSEFGFAKLIDQAKDGICGTAPPVNLPNMIYANRELINKVDFVTCMVDYWALIATFSALVTGEVPFDNFGYKDDVTPILFKNSNRIWERFVNPYIKEMIVDLAWCYSDNTNEYCVNYIDKLRASNEFLVLDFDAIRSGTVGIFDENEINSIVVKASRMHRFRRGNPSSNDELLKVIQNQAQFNNLVSSGNLKRGAGLSYVDIPSVSRRKRRKVVPKSKPRVCREDGLKITTVTLATDSEDSILESASD